MCNNITIKAAGSVCSELFLLSELLVSNTIVSGWFMQLCLVLLCVFFFFLGRGGRCLVSFLYNLYMPHLWCTQLCHVFAMSACLAPLQFTTLRVITSCFVWFAWCLLVCPQHPTNLCFSLLHLHLYMFYVGRAHGHTKKKKKIHTLLPSFL